MRKVYRGSKDRKKFFDYWVVARIVPENGWGERYFAVFDNEQDARLFRWMNQGEIEEWSSPLCLLEFVAEYESRGDAIAYSDVQFNSFRFCCYGENDRLRGVKYLKRSQAIDEFWDHYGSPAPEFSRNADGRS